MNYGNHRNERGIPKIVRGTRNEALGILEITPDEQVAFVTYLNYAVNNLCEVSGVELSGEANVRDKLDAGNPDAIQSRLRKLADFLWAFREKDPSADEAGYKRTLGSGHEEMAVWVAEEIVALRNLFSHVNRKDCAPLVIDKSKQVFVEGILGDAAREATMAPGLNSAKAQKLKLATTHIKEDSSFEFTRKGLIFLTCLALYKDEAEEFCHLFKEMKVPDRIDDADLDEELEDGRVRRVIGKEDMARFAGLKGKGRALIELFTFYSYRRGRQALASADLDFMCFADIVGCLNKVPAPAFDYLSLDKERRELEALAAASTESEKNKRTKYVLRRRDRNRFLSFAAAYCEDFDVLPSICFKRLDVRQTTGRHQFVFGKEADKSPDEKENNRVRMNRHYAIQRDAIAFEFKPESHYGPIRIGSLRSSISATEMRKLLYLHAQGRDANAAVKRYFSAYHRVLERMVNAGEIEDISLDDETYLADFATICGTTPEAFRASPESFRPFVHESLRRYFTKEAGVRTDAELLYRLSSKIWASIDRYYDILARYKMLEKWREDSRPWLDAMDAWHEAVDKWRAGHAGQSLPGCLTTIDDYIATLPEGKRPTRPDDPRCRIGDGDDEVSAPPTWCRFSDADYVSFVFDYLNLHLTNDRKFRQLPLSEQHRDGIEDHLFQVVHTAIGKFSLDQTGLWSLLERQRPELVEQVDYLREQLDDDVCVRPLIGCLNYHLADNRKLPMPGMDLEPKQENLLARLKELILEFKARDFFEFLKKERPELEGYCEKIRHLLNSEMEKKARRKDGRRPLPKLEDLFKVAQISRRPSTTLEDLAVSAVKLLRNEYKAAKDKWEAADAATTAHGELLAACRKYGVRPGMPLERKSLLKTILGIGYDSWRHAFDYASGRPYENRLLENEEHVAAQIPLPNGFAERMAGELPRKLREAFVKPAAGNACAAFDSNAAFRAWSPDAHVALRDFYGTKPLVEAFLAKKKGGATASAGSPLAMLEPKRIDSLIREIKDVENQDKVLLFVAMKYWERFQGSDTFSKKAMPFTEKTTLREFFDTPVAMNRDGLSITLRPNDVNRPSFATLFGESRSAKDYRRKIARILSPDGSRKAFDFYEMVAAFREQKALDRHERLAFTPYAVNFDATCDIPASEYNRVQTGLEGAAKAAATREMEFGRYKAVIPGLTREDYECIADTRNAVFHTGFLLDCSKAIDVCRRLGISGSLPGAVGKGGKPFGHGKPKWKGGNRRRDNDHGRW